MMTKFNPKDGKFTFSAEKDCRGETDWPSGERSWLSCWFSPWIGSLVFHALIFLVAFWVIKSAPRTGNVMGERTTGRIGLVFSEGEAEAEESGGGEPVAPTENSANENSSEISNPPPTLEVPPPTRPMERLGTQEKTTSSNSTSVKILSPPGAANRSGGGATQGGAGGGSGSGQRVGLGELQGSGRRFVYVLDRSESMRWPNDRPIRYALAEASASVASLDPKKGALKFQLVVYHHDAQVFGDGRLMDVAPMNQKRVADFLGSLVATGGTDPLDAIEKAIALKPDVIFFLTDADEEIPPMVLARIREKRIRNRVGQIHVMEFGNPGSRRLQSFQRLAEQNNGLYIFKDITGI